MEQMDDMGDFWSGCIPESLETSKNIMIDSRKKEPKKKSGYYTKPKMEKISTKSGYYTKPKI